MLHLGNVSEDILIHIASFLEFDDLWRLRQVCVQARMVASSASVWRTASSRLRLPIRSTDSASHPRSPSAPPNTLIRDTWRAMTVDRRWSAASPYRNIHRPADGGAWVGIGLVGGGQWVLCVNQDGDVAATHVAQVIRSSTEQQQIIHEPPVMPVRDWYGLVGWFRAPAVLIVQLQSNLRSLKIYSYALPPRDRSSALTGTEEQLSHCELSLAPRTTVSAIQVCAQRRCLMVLCKEPNNSPPWFVGVWCWGPDEEDTRHPPCHAMRTAYFEANDCVFRLVETKEGPHVLVVRASKHTTHFEFYDLPKHMTNPDQIEPEPQIPIACESIPWACHQITLPQPGDAPATDAPERDDRISVVLCIARSPRLSELLSYHVSLEGQDRRLAVRLSFLGGSTLAEFSDVTRCVLGERGVRGVAIISDPRSLSKTELVLLTLGNDGLAMHRFSQPMDEDSIPAAVAIDELCGTLAILGSDHEMRIYIFDPEVILAE